MLAHTQKSFDFKVSPFHLYMFKIHTFNVLMHTHTFAHGT